MAGFYGRLTNESKTSMTFDRVYPNRVTMDAHADDDGVFNGRFVLVEYTLELTEDSTVKDYLDDKESGKGDDYSDLCTEAAEGAESTELDLDQYYYNYNYSVDKLLYSKLGRGNDSTVWRKVVSSDSEGNVSSQYVMLAELNSVVPSFDVTPVAPSDDPIKPTFSEDSSNVYYNLKMGSTWGFDVKEMEYNRPGLNKEVHSDELLDDADKITLENTGYSISSVYEGERQPDIKELKVHLPSIGKMVSEGWDKIYGYNEDTGRRDTNIEWLDGSDAEGRRPLEYGNGAIINDALIETDGVYNKAGNSPEFTNLADALRYTYDVLGMIIQPISLDEYLNPQNVLRPNSATSPGYIYYLEPKNVTLTTTTKELADIAENDYAPNTYYIISSDEYVLDSSETFDSEKEYYVEVTNEEEVDEIDTCESLSADEQDWLKNHRFLYLGYKYDFLNEPGIVAEPTDKKVAHEIVAQVHDFEPNSTFVPIDYITEVNAQEGTEAVIPFSFKKNQQENAIADQIYYKLKTNLFDGLDPYEATDKSFKDLIRQGNLYKQSRADSAVQLTKIIDENETYDISTYKYFIVNQITPDTTIDNNGYAAAIFQPTVGTRHIFFDQEGRPYIDTDEYGQAYNFYRLNNGTPIYLMGNPRTDYTEQGTVITTVYEQVGVKDDTLCECSVGALPSNRKILPWPLNNNKTKGINNGEIFYGTWDPSKENEEEQAKHFWTCTEWDTNGNPLTFTLQSAPSGRDFIASSEKDAALMITGQDIQEGHDKRVHNLYRIIGIEQAANFIIPDTNFWVKTPDDERIYYVTEGYMPTGDDLNYVYQLSGKNKASDLIIGPEGQKEGQKGIKGSRIYSDQDAFYFVPNEIYKEINYDSNLHDEIVQIDGHYYIKATENDVSTYYTILDLCIQSDPSGQFNIGEEWNDKLNLTDINAGKSADEKTVLNYKITKPTFFPLDGYAKDLNTINGIILALNRLIGGKDDNSRDRETIEGLINILNDKLDKLDDIPGDSLVVTDKYGHLNGATRNDENGREEERAIITQPVGENVTQATDFYPWVTYYIEGTPGNYRVAEPQPTSQESLDGGTFYIKEPIFGADHYVTDTGSYVAPITISGMPNTWITADVETTSTGDPYVYILHNTVTPVVSTATISVGTSSITIPVQKATYDAAGHVSTISDVDLVLPTVSGDSWISVTSSDSILTISHIGPVSTATVTISDETPKFGGTFTVSDFTIDARGHVVTTTTHAVTIPAITFTSTDSLVWDGYTAVTSLGFDSTSGAIMVKKDPIDNAELGDYVTATDDGIITTSTTIAEAIALLEYRISGGLTGITATLTFTSSDNVLSLGLNQVNGRIQDLTGSVDLITLATTTLGAAGEGGQPDTYILTTAAKDIAGAINELKDRIDRSVFDENDYSRIFRINGPPATTSAQSALTVSNDYDIVNRTYSYTGSAAFNATTRPFRTGWMWVNTTNGYIYLCTSVASDSVNWELLNSWR